jgi:hypothetical protein
VNRSTYSVAINLVILLKDRPALNNGYKFCAVQGGKAGLALPNMAPAEYCEYRLYNVANVRAFVVYYLIALRRGSSPAIYF